MHTSSPDSLRPALANLPLRRRAALTLFAALLGLVALATPRVLAASSAVAFKVGDAFPDLATFQLDGTIPDTKGKVVLVDFWATWCVTCKKSFPVLAELQEKYGPRGFVVVGVSVDERKSALKKYLEKNPAPFAVVHDAKGKLAETVNLELMPTSLIIGADGKVRVIHAGFEGDATRKKYVEEIEAALADAGKKP